MLTSCILRVAHPYCNKGDFEKGNEKIKWDYLQLSCADDSTGKPVLLKIRNYQKLPDIDLNDMLELAFPSNMIVKTTIQNWGTCDIISLDADNSLVKIKVQSSIR